MSTIPTDVRQIAEAPASRWDRLVSVLEVVDPERVIDAFHILERAKKHNVSDIQLFYLLGLRYQEQQAKPLAYIVSLYVMMDSTLKWLREVVDTLQLNRHDRGLDDLLRASDSSPKKGSTCSKEESNSIPKESVSAPVFGYSAVGGNNSLTRSFDPQEMRSTLPGSSPTLKSKGRSRRVQPAMAVPASGECSINFLRDGKLILNILQTAIRARAARNAAVPPSSCAQAKPPGPGSGGSGGGGGDAPAKASYDVRFPSLADLDRMAAKTTTATSPRGSPTNRHITFPPSATGGRHSSAGQRTHRRSKGFSRSFRMIEQQEKSVEETEARVQQLNELCEQHLGWKPADRNGKPFLEFKSSEMLVHPTNDDDLYVLKRLQWFMVALYVFIADERIVPRPSGVSIICFNNSHLFLDLPPSESDTEISIAIATKCSCLPSNSKLNVTLPERNLVRISHPTAHPLPLFFGCVLVKHIVFVYMEPISTFLPLWAVLQHFVSQWDNVFWYFEMSREERELADGVIGGPALPTTQGGGKAGQLEDAPFVPNFDLRIQSSSKNYRLQVPMSTVNKRRLGTEMQTLDEGAHITLQSQPFSTVKTVRRPPTATVAESTVARKKKLPSSPVIAEGDEEEEEAPLAPRPSSEKTLIDDAAEGSLTTAEEISGLQQPQSTCTPTATIRSTATNTSRVGSSSYAHTDGRLEKEESSFREETLTLHMEGTGYEYTEEASAMSVDARRVVNFSAAIVNEIGPTAMEVNEHHFRVSGKPIGKGAFGAVYRALDLETGRFVAVKQSRYTYANGQTNLNWREFETWSVLPPHPHVITFCGASMEVDTQQLLLVLEYASGGSIVSMYQNFRPIPEHLFYRHALGIALGLKHLHDHNVIHGDVKPENVLTRSDGSVALSDFGCSRLPVGADGTPCSIISRETSTLSSSMDPSVDDMNDGSPTFQLFGTVAYMAPEVIMNEPDFKSDVWAYVCMLVYMWTGILPWSTIVENFSIHDTIPLIFLIGNEDKLPYREEDILKTPRWLQKLSARVLERDVSKRFSTTEVLALLAEYEHV